MGRAMLCAAAVVSAAFAAATETATLNTFAFKVHCTLDPTPASQQVALTDCGHSPPGSEDPVYLEAWFGFGARADDDDLGPATNIAVEVTLPARNTTTPDPKLATDDDDGAPYFGPSTKPVDTAVSGGYIFDYSPCNVCKVRTGCSCQPQAGGAWWKSDANGTEYIAMWGSNCSDVACVVTDAAHAHFPAVAAYAAAQAAVADGNALVTFSQLNTIVGVSGAKAGVEYTAALHAARHTFASVFAPTPVEIQAVVTAVNAAAARTTPCDICSIPDGCSCVLPETGSWWQTQDDLSVLAVFSSNCTVTECKTDGSLAKIAPVTTPKPGAAVSGGCIFGEQVDDCTCSSVGQNATVCVRANEPTINMNSHPHTHSIGLTKTQIAIIAAGAAALAAFTLTTSMAYKRFCGGPRQPTPGHTSLM